MTFSEKIRKAREVVGLTQSGLASACGVSQRTIASYETGNAIARRKTTERLAKALRVSTTYLLDETCTDPLQNIERDGYIEEARRLYGSAGARDIDRLMQENTALFAGGELSQEEKDAFFQALMTAYVTAKEAARKKYGAGD